jgi:hypothetical protein
MLKILTCHFQGMQLILASNIEFSQIHLVSKRRHKDLYLRQVDTQTSLSEVDLHQEQSARWSAVTAAICHLSDRLDN